MPFERELPRYKCHKEVWALKIEKIEPDTAAAGSIITPADAGYAPFAVGYDYMSKHTPEVGGYYIVYADGYKSFSPASVFEEGYTKV